MNILVETKSGVYMITDCLKFEHVQDKECNMFEFTKKANEKERKFKIPDVVKTTIIYDFLGVI